MLTGSRRPWWPRLCSIYFVVSIVSPASAPFQAIDRDWPVQMDARPALAKPVRTARPAGTVAHDHGVPSARASHGRVRLRVKQATGTGLVSAPVRPRCARRLRLNPDASFRLTDQPLTVLRI